MKDDNLQLSEKIRRIQPTTTSDQHRAAVNAAEWCLANEPDPALACADILEQLGLKEAE